MIKQLLSRLNHNYDKKTLLTTALSVLIGIAYAVYNGVLGGVYHSVWHITIGVYYVSLFLVRLFLLTGELTARKKQDGRIPRRFVIVSFFFLLLMTVAMIYPVILMVRNQRSYDWGLIPAIAMATYTTYSLTMAIVHLNKASDSDDPIVKQARFINMIAALMSVLVLQNTLILANGDFTTEMVTLSACSSAVVLAVVIAMLTRAFIKVLKDKPQSVDI